MYKKWKGVQKGDMRIYTHERIYEKDQIAFDDFSFVVSS